MQYIALYTVFLANYSCLSHFESSRAESKFLSQVEISPTPGVFQSQFPTPMGDGGGDPMGSGGGAQTLVKMVVAPCRIKKKTFILSNMEGYRNL